MPPGRYATQKDRNRHVRALELSLGGKTDKEIAEILGYANHSGARYARTKELDRRAIPAAAEYRKLHDARLTRLLASIWDKALAGDLSAVDRALATLDRLARLHGLDAAQRHLIVELSADDFATKAQELLTKLDTIGGPGTAQKALQAAARGVSSADVIEAEVVPAEPDGERWSNL